MYISFCRFERCLRKEVPSVPVSLSSQLAASKQVPEDKAQVDEVGASGNREPEAGALAA